MIMTIQCDTREHSEQIERIEKQFDDLGVKHFRSKLYCGDYQSLDNARLVIDRKKDLQELCGNVCQQHERFKAELIRAQEHGHQPLVFENHGIDARYTGPYDVAPTMAARYGTGGNNTPLVARDTSFCITGNAIDRKPENGGNGLGIDEDVAFTLTATDHHAVFARQRTDVFREDEVASTESARQHKDATDLVLEAQDEIKPTQLIRRLMPIECERLQGYPDGWTDIPGASDSSRYKALGNSVAIPCVELLIMGIAFVIREGRDNYSTVGAMCRMLERNTI